MMLPFQHYFNAVSPLQAETWEAILPHFHETQLMAGDYFVKEHVVAHQIAFLQSGIVRAFFTNQKGQEYNKQFFVGPSSIGAYTSLLTGKSNLIPQQALTPCTIWACEYEKLTRLYPKFHDLERLARKIAEHYFLEKEKKELEIVLLDAAQRYELFQDEFPTVAQQIPQYHIASYLGITPTQLSRIRRQSSRK
jgi:CRP-like cAMP-binding protein